MCVSRQTGNELEGPLRRKRRLWELNEYLCSVIGTCLSNDELKKLQKRIRQTPNATQSAYELHLLFVQKAGETGPDSKFIEKKLNRKFQLPLRQAAKIKSPEALIDFWHYSKKQNRLAGAYWAILTHPLASSSLCAKVYGEVHMLSHLAGRQTGHDHQKIRRRQERIDVLQEALWLAQNQARQEMAWRDEEIVELKIALEKQQGNGRQLQLARRKIAVLEGEDSRRELLNTKRTLGYELETTSARCREVVTENKTLVRENRHLTDRLHQLEAAQTELAAQNHTLEQVLHGRSSCDSCQCKDCPAVDLCGRRVLYVGGQHNLVPRYRQIIEECGGRFIHHDGGKEEHRTRLGALLSQADAVICPVNCVSHDACLRAKRLCKHQTKPFIAIRSASLAALTVGLGEITADTLPANAESH